MEMTRERNGDPPKKEASIARPNPSDGHPLSPQEIDRVFDEDGLSDEARLREAEEKLSRDGRFRELVEIYSAAVQRAPSAELGLRFLLRGGRIALEEVKDLRLAEPFFRRVLASDPENLEALRALMTLSVQAGRYDEAADLSDRAIAAASDAEKPDLLIALAQLAFDPLHHVERAVTALRFAHEIDPGRLDVLAEARRIFVAEERWADAKQVLDDEAASSPSDRAPVIGEAYRELGVLLLGAALMHPLAEECLERARALGDNDALSKLDELAHIRKEWESRAKALRDEALEARDKRKAAQLYLRAAELYHAYGRDPIRADEYLERCLLLCPGFPAALRFIEATHLDQGRGEDLIRKLNAMAASVKDPSIKVEILLRVARHLSPSDATDTRAAAPMISAYRRALALDPAHPSAVENLSRILGEEGLPAERAQVFEAQIAATSDEYLKTEAHLELGRIYAEELGDSPRARAHFEAVLGLNPTHFESASALRALYKDAGEHASLLGVLKILVEYTPDLFSKLELLHEMAEVARDVSREEAFVVQRRIFELDPNAKGVQEKLEELATQLQRYQALADAFSLAARSKSGERAFDLWVAAARLYDTRLPRPLDAIQAYKRALEIKPDEEELQEALERLLRQQDDPAALVEVLRRQLARNTDPEQAPVLLAKIGGVLDRDLGDLDGATDAFTRVLELDPGNTPALVNLDDLYRRREDWESLIAILVRREECAETAADRSELQYRRARVLDERLHRSEEAAATYLDVLGAFPDHAEVVQSLGKLLAEGTAPDRIARALEPIYAQRGQFARQIDMLAVLIEREPDPRTRREHARRAAQTAEHRLGNPALAFDFTAVAVRADPASDEAREALLRLADATRDHEAAAEVLASALEAPGLDGSTLSRTACALAELCDGQLERRSDAIELYQRALRAEGGNAVAVAALERLLGAEERWAELAELLEERISRSPEPQAKVTLGLSLAAIRDQRLRDLDRAIDAYKDVLAVEPSESTALSKLAEALERQERYRELVSVLDRLGDASPDPERQAMTDVKVGDVLRTRLRDGASAVERYRRALERRPGSSGAVRGLEALLEDVEMRARAGALLEPYYEQSERWGDLVIALESRLSAVGAAGDRKEILFRIARIERDALGQTEAAFETLSRAFRECEFAQEDREEILEIALASHRARELAQLYQDALTASPNDPEITREVARLYDGAAADPALARTTWEKLLQIRQNDPEALEALERLHAAGDNPAALAEVLLVRAEASSGSDRVAYLKRASAIYEEAAEDLDRAIAAMERARLEQPRDRSTLQELGRLYSIAGKVEKLRDALDAESQLIEEPIQRANVLVRLAEVLVSLGELEEAVSALSAAISAMPEHGAARQALEALLKSSAAPKAALALEPVYRAAGDWAHLVDAYEILAEASRDPTERVERLVAIRSIYEERLGKLDRAFAAAARAYREAPYDEELLDALERLGRLSGSVNELLGILEDQAESLPFVSQERHDTRVRIATLTEALVHDRELAIEAWRRALEEQPGSLTALEALERLYVKTGDARELVDVLRTMAGLVEDPARRAQHLRRAAQLLDERLGDRAQAARLYAQVLTLAPREREALRRLDVIYTEARAFEDLSAVLVEEIAAATTSEERTLFQLRLGNLRLNALHDPRGALDAFAGVLAEGSQAAHDTYERALAAIDGIIEQLKASNPEVVALAAELIEPHWAKKGDLFKLVSAKEARVAAAVDAESRRALRFEIAAIYEQELGQPDMAFLALARAYGEAPQDAELPAALERLALAADIEEELADLYAQALPAIEESDLALRLARRVAHVYDDILDRGEAAVPYYNRILDVVPDDSSALTALERIHRRAGNAPALVAVYRAMLRFATEDIEQQKNIWKQIAEIMEYELSDLEGAFDAYRAMTSIDPSDTDVLRAMGALCERSGRMDELARVLQREIEGTDRPDDRAQLLLRLATLRREKLGDLAGAVQAFKEVLALRREDPGAIAGLAALAREGGEARAKASEALAPIYLSNGAFGDYIACLEAQIGAAARSDDRKELLIRIAEVYENRLGRPEHAFTYSCRALHEDLQDGAVRARIERLAQENGAMEDLAAFYLDEIDAVTDHDLALLLRRRVADIYDHDLGDVPRAIAEHNRILDVAPGDPESLKTLERLYRVAGSFGSLAEVYRRRIAQTEEPEARAHLLREFARLQAEELRDAPGAIATLRRLLDVAPDDVDALERLARLCADQGRASELADVLERLIQVAEEGGAVQHAAMFGLGKLRVERLGDLGGAEALFRAVLGRDPRHAETREYLQERLENALAEDEAQVAQSTGAILVEAMREAREWQSLIAVLRVLCGMAGSAFERVELNREIARLHREHLGEPELAFNTLAQVYRDAPGLEDVRQELEELAESLLLFERLVEVFEAGLGEIPDADVALDVQRRIAQILERNVGDRERAASAWQRVLLERPMDPEGLEALDRLNLALGRWAALTDILEKRLELAGDDAEVKHEIYVRLGAIWDERLGEPGEAIEAYRKARAMNPRDQETLQALARLLDPADASQELFAVLEALSESAKDARVLLRLLPRMANLAGEFLDRRPLGIELWRKVLALDPHHGEALKGLEQLYEAEARWEDLAHHLERQVQTARDEKEVMRLQRRLGLIKGTRLGSVDEAVRSWSEILKRNPNDLEALNALRDIYRSASRWEDLVTTLRKLIPLQPDTAGVKSIRFELAEVFLTHLGQRDEAIESAKRVLDVEPHTEAELMRLEEIFIAAGAHGEAVKVMNARVELAERASEKIDILFEIAQVYESKIGRRAGAASAYERVLTLEPSSVKAYDALAAIYQSNGDYRKLVELHNRRLEKTEEVAERRRLLFEIIDIQENWLGEPVLAFTAACRAFGEEGADERAQTIAERLAEETGSWEILAEVYEEQVEQVGVQRSVDLRRRLAAIYTQKLEDPARAEHQLEIVLSTRPEDETARSLLLQILESQSRWRDLVVQLQDQVDVVTDVDLKKELFRQIADVEEKKLEDVEAAISSTKRILDLDPADRAALGELTRMFRESAKWHPLLAMLGRSLEITEDPEERIELRFEIAGVWEQGIQDLEHAIEAYRDVLAIEANHLPSLQALERLFTQLERWNELVDVFERQVALAAEEAEAIQLLTRIAAIWEEEFRDLDTASATLIRILEINPEHLQTVKSLERVWRRAGDWERLIEAHKRHLELIDDPVETVELYVAMGEIYLRELERTDQAEEAYKIALEFDPSSRDAVHALGQLYEKGGNWFNALEMLQQEANLIGATPESVDLFYRMGKINEDMLMDREAAKRAYNRALDLSPSYLPAIRSLRTILESERNHTEVVTLLAQEAEYTEDRTQRAGLYQRAAETAIDQTDQVERAVGLYERSLEAVSEHVPSLRALGDLYFADESWEKAERILERLVDKLDRHDDLKELCKQYYRLAYIAEKLGDDHGALKRYLASYELDATYLPTLEGLAAALLRAERWEDAQRIFQTILIHHKGSLTDAEVVDLHFQLGELAVRLNQLDRAKKSFDKALDLDQDHAQTLRAYARLAEMLEEWEEAYDLRERLIVHLEGEDRFLELVDQAKLCRDKIQEPYRAIDAYCEARRYRPENQDVLRALVKLFDETSQSQRTIEVLEELSKLVESDVEKRDLFVELARVHYDQQRNVPEAVRAFNRALDLDPTHVKAFERIERILYEARNWRALEENYHRMIQRMPKEQKGARVVLWRSLGDLYLRVLKNDDGAKVAYEVVLKLAPESKDVALQLAELCSRSRESLPKAVELYHRMLPDADDPAVPARRLFEIYTELNQLDRALCAVGALLLMRAATESEQKAYALLLKKAPTSAKRALTDNLWRTVLLHVNCRNSLADISSILYRGAPDLFGETQKSLLLKKKERVDLSDPKNARARLRYFDVWQRLTSAMHVGEMDHYHRPSSTQAPRMYPGAPPVLFVGEQHEAFKEMAPRQIAWLLARQMACCRPELALARSLQPDEAAAAIEAAIQIYAPEGSGVDLQVDQRAVQAWKKALHHRLSERALKALKDPVVTCLERREMRHLARFLEGAEHSASRAALLMAGDVVVAERGLGDSDQLVDVSFRARVRALMLYCLSEDYFVLREKLGLSIAS